MSKTIWFNVFMALVAFASEMLVLLDHFVVLGLPPEYEGIARTVLTVTVTVANLTEQAPDTISSFKWRQYRRLQAAYQDFLS
ncbi:hypothetical protein [Ruegeria arenilitoris]|uniref:hypothetical protein n=1 Tax=Ruegeria arenilitoris TaxID=1173585 RepID=UPI00147CB7E5|nr:hypothetical protein [Ruegeria arenilitoris]